jgi:hypothetical protein
VQMRICQRTYLVLGSEGIIVFGNPILSNVSTEGIPSLTRLGFSEPLGDLEAFPSLPSVDDRSFTSPIQSVGNHSTSFKDSLTKVPLETFSGKHSPNPDVILIASHRFPNVTVRKPRKEVLASVSMNSKKYERCINPTILSLNFH